MTLALHWYSCVSLLLGGFQGKERVYVGYNYHFGLVSYFSSGNFWVGKLDTSESVPKLNASLHLPKEHLTFHWCITKRNKGHT